MSDQDRTPFLDRPGATALISAVAVVLAAVISGVFLVSSGGEQHSNTTGPGAISSTPATPPPPAATPGDTDAGAPSAAPTDFEERTLNMPLSDEGTVGLFLDQGRVSTECCGADFDYSRQDATGRPQLESNSGVPYSTAVKSATVTRDECSQAVATSPTIRPIRPLRAGMLICVTTNGGTSLLRVAETPQPDGTLKISQKFWPDP